MFRPNVAIIRFTSESMVVLLYRNGTDMSRWYRTIPVKQYHHTFGCKPDDGHIRPKHVVYFILY